MQCLVGVSLSERFLEKLTYPQLEEPFKTSLNYYFGLQKNFTGKQITIISHTNKPYLCGQSERFGKLIC